MLYDSYFKNPGDVPALLDKIRVYTDRSGPIRLMEICGTHTMAIARAHQVNKENLAKKLPYFE